MLANVLLKLHKRLVFIHLAKMANRPIKVHTFHLIADRLLRGNAFKPPPPLQRHGRGCTDEYSEVGETILFCVGVGLVNAPVDPLNRVLPSEGRGQRF